MAEIAEGGGGGHGHKGKKRAKKQSTKVDMTPMVDLAFLLLTFFVLTATFSKNKAMDITFPAPPENITDIPPVNNALTFILSKDDRVFYYYNQLITKDTPPEENKSGAPITQLTEITYAPEGGIEDLLMEKNKGAFDKIKELDKKREEEMEPVKKIDDPVKKKKETAKIDSIYKKDLSSINNKNEAVTVIIKTDDKATYKNMVMLIDELKVLKITKFVNVDMSVPEKALLDEKVK